MVKLCSLKHFFLRHASGSATRLANLPLRPVSRGMPTFIPSSLALDLFIIHYICASLPNLLNTEMLVKMHGVQYDLVEVEPRLSLKIPNIDCVVCPASPGVIQ